MIREKLEQIKEFAENQNLFICGQTASGKSIFLKNIIDYYINKNENSVFCFIDPKRFELKRYLNCKISFFGGVKKTYTEKEETKDVLHKLENEIRERIRTGQTDTIINVFFDEIIDFIINDFELLSTTDNIDYELWSTIEYIIKNSSIANVRVFLCLQYLRMDILERLKPLFTSIVCFRTMEEEVSLFLTGKEDAARLDCFDFIYINNKEVINKTCKRLPYKLDLAIEFAVKKHSCSYRKGGLTPYIVHPLEALTIASTITDDMDVLAAAVLHDTVEDTDTTLSDIKLLFGEYVAFLVASDSENKREELSASETWEIRKTETLKYLETADKDEQIIALSDKLSNLRAINRDLFHYGNLVKEIELYPEYKHLLKGNYWDKFNVNEESKHAWYYCGIAKRLKDLTDTFAYKEYVELLKKVFGEKLFSEQMS